MTPLRISGRSAATCGSPMADGGPEAWRRGGHADGTVPGVAANPRLQGANRRGFQTASRLRCASRDHRNAKATPELPAVSIQWLLPAW